MEKNPKRVLVVDDDEIIRDVYRDMLQHIGYAVVTAADGQDGINKLRDGGYDLVLLDVMMPRLDGIEVLKLLKNNPPANPIGPIILLTNMAQSPVIDEAIMLGATSYIIKSDVSSHELIEKIRGFIQ